MKPTQEQVIAWAREANGEEAWSGGVEWLWGEVERFATLAYEAGRKDENEACAKMCEDLDHFAADCIDCAAGIRTRMKP